MWIKLSIKEWDELAMLQSMFAFQTGTIKALLLLGISPNPSSHYLHWTLPTQLWRANFNPRAAASGI
jgi:hypothetical protein